MNGLCTARSPWRENIRFEILARGLKDRIARPIISCKIVREIENEGTTKQHSTKSIPDPGLNRVYKIPGRDSGLFSQ